MANYATLKAAIAAAIKQNGNNEITGALLQQQLLAMVNSLGANYQYAGVATSLTDPGTPDQNVFYIASTDGTYANFGGLVLADGEIAILKYNGTWSKDSTDVASVGMVNQLGEYIENQEWVRVITDNDGKILYGVKVDGNFYFGGDCPPQVKKYVLDSLADALFDKVDKVDGKSLINADYASSQNVIENSEYLFAFVDTDGKVVFGIRKNGLVDAPFFQSQTVYEEIQRKKENLKDEILQYIESNNYTDVICCDGDSLTFGDLGASAQNSQAVHNYPAVLQAHLGGKFKINNYGNRGAPSPTILNNAVGYKIMEDITIPSDKTPVIFDVNMIKDSTNVESYTFAPTRDSENVGTNPCYIDGIKGHLSSIQVGGVNKARFVRETLGESKKVYAGDIVYTHETINNRKATHIIFMGANRGFIITGGTTADSVNELIKQYQCIINTSSDLYICMLYWGFVEPYESMFESAFGNHFLNLREYLCTDAINDALERGYLVNEDPAHPTYPTSADLAAMANGECPPTLLASDNLHMTDVGYHLIGDLVYKKYQDLYKSKINNLN